MHPSPCDILDGQEVVGRDTPPCATPRRCNLPSRLFAPAQTGDGSSSMQDRTQSSLCGLESLCERVTCCTFFCYHCPWSLFFFTGEEISLLSPKGNQILLKTFETTRLRKLSWHTFRKILQVNETPSVRNEPNLLHGSCHSNGKSPRDPCNITTSGHFPIVLLSFYKLTAVCPEKHHFGLIERTFACTVLSGDIDVRSRNMPCLVLAQRHEYILPNFLK